MRRLSGLLVIAFALLAAAPVVPRGARLNPDLPKSPVLAAIEPGKWELRGAGSDPVTLCIGNVQALLQVRHGAIACSWYVVANEARLLTISYRCPRAGYGLTTVKLETPRLIQVETQGIADNQPFALSLEGRKTGECPATPARVVTVR